MQETNEITVFIGDAQLHFELNVDGVTKIRHRVYDGSPHVEIYRDGKVEMYVGAPYRVELSKSDFL